nr:hypothetical protein [Tanacetum cinerariifolium]
CESLYTRDCSCSEGSVEDKILVPKPPGKCARCAKCGHPFNGSYFQGCTILREKLEEDLVTYFQKFQNTSESSDGSTNVVNAPREPFIVKQDHGVNPPHIDECCCECGETLDGIICQRCALPCVSKPNFVDESSNIFIPPLRPPIHSCEICRNNAQYGHYCTPQAPFINPEPVWGPVRDFSMSASDLFEIGKFDVVVVPDSEDTLMHAEESRSKMIEKQNDPQMIEKKTESSAEQAFWSQYSMQTDEPNLSGTTIVEVPKELPKVSMVNSCLKKLKFHLASFDMVVKERTNATAITEGTWGFEHTKACFRDDIIPFVKNLKELFTSFDQCLIDEVTEVQNIFKKIELAVEQQCAEKTKFQIKMENVLKENDRLLTQALSVEIMNIVVHDYVNFDCLNVDACVHCVTTESELKQDFIKKECYKTLIQQYHILETHCISLEVNN